MRMFVFLCLFLTIFQCPVRMEINTALLMLEVLCANHTTEYRGDFLSFSTLTGTGNRCFATRQKSVYYTCFQAGLVAWQVISW